MAAVLDEKMLSQLDAAARLHMLPDSMVLSSKEAAVFLRLSLRTLEDLRRSGEGPSYAQAPGGSNRPCLYQKGDLLAWIGNNKLGSVAENAVRNGIVFALTSLVEESAFWVTESGLIVGAVESTPIADVPRLLAECQVEWLPAIEVACSRDWIAADAHEEFAGHVQAKLSNAGASVRAGVERTVLREVLADAPPARDMLRD